MKSSQMCYKMLSKLRYMNTCQRSRDDYLTNTLFLFNVCLNIQINQNFLEIQCFPWHINFKFLLGQQQEKVILRLTKTIKSPDTTLCFELFFTFVLYEKIVERKKENEKRKTQRSGVSIYIMDMDTKKA